MAASDDEPAPNATLYLRGLNEKVKISDLVAGIRELFEDIGTVVDVVAKKNMKAKGQAFVVFESAEEAQDAKDTLNGIELFGKPIEAHFAKSRSDATVEREDGKEGLEEHKRHRIAEKERKQAIEAANAKPTKRPAADSLAERPAKTPKAGANANAGGAVPDEYLPPNKTLVLQNAPADYTGDQLKAIFSQYSGFKEIRMVPGRAGLGFVQYEDENSAISAKEATSGMTLGENTIRVTYQRQ